jgi:hypothetical protein
VAGESTIGILLGAGTLIGLCWCVVRLIAKAAAPERPESAWGDVPYLAEGLRRPARSIGEGMAEAGHTQVLARHIAHDAESPTS